MFPRCAESLCSRGRFAVWPFAERHFTGLVRLWIVGWATQVNLTRKGITHSHLTTYAVPYPNSYRYAHIRPSLTIEQNLLCSAEQARSDGAPGWGTLASFWLLWDSGFNCESGRSSMGWKDRVILARRDTETWSFLALLVRFKLRKQNQENPTFSSFEIQMSSKKLAVYFVSDHDVKIPNPSWFSKIFAKSTVSALLML